MEDDCKYLSFNVGFLTDDGRIDETQFDIPISSEELSKEIYGYFDIAQRSFEMSGLLFLWEEFRQENGLIHPEILYVMEVPYSEV